MFKLIILTFILHSLYANNLTNLLLDIQNNNRINLSKYNLIQGWNEEEKVFISKGVALFDFNNSTYINDKRNFSMVAFIDSKTTISEFLSSKITAKDIVVFNNNDDKIISNANLSTETLLKNSYSIFQEEKLDKETGIYKIINYMIWSKDLDIKLNSNLSIKEYLKNIDLSKINGSRFFLDKNNNYYLINFSKYPISNNLWQDRMSANNLAKREIISMLKTDINSESKIVSSLSHNSKFLSKQKQNINSINIQNIKQELQKIFQDNINGKRYLLTIYSYKIKD
jgi:hypothetical protein